MKAVFAAIVIAAVGVSGTAMAGAQKNPIAVFAGLDKVTGRITTFEIKVDDVRRFGSLNVRPRVCYTRPITEEPKTTSFLEVDQNNLDGSLTRIFTGWMLAQSPGLNAIEHPVYDIWLTGCRNPKVQLKKTLDLPPVKKSN